MVTSQLSPMIKLLSIGLAMLLLSACVYLKPAQRPMGHQFSLQRDANNLLILLPGMGDSIEHFYRHQFPQMLQQRHSNWDVLVLDAHFGYYRERVIIEAFKQDILPLIKQKSYQKVIVGGISLGGFGSLLLQHELNGEIDGLLLMAAYLGDDEELEQAMQQPISRWVTKGDKERKQQILVSWYHAYRDRTLVGFGGQDQFAEANLWLTQNTPQQNIYQLPGNHKWPTWHKLWQQMLDHPSFWQ